MKKIKILFVEDHEMVRNGIKLMLNNQSAFQVEIEEATNGSEAVHLASKNNYDVILLDINLPKMDGVKVAKLLCSKNDSTRILALTTHKEDFIIKQMLDAGALGYILKNSGLEELTKAILTVFNGKPYYSNDVSQVLIKNTKGISNGEGREGQYISPFKNNLTARELEILKHIALEYTNKEIGEKLNISERTVGNHRYKLIQKLQVKNSIGLATFAVKNGLV